MHHGKKPKVRHLTGITYKLAFYIGLFQLIAAIFPGTSRSGATIVGALIFGISRTVAAEYTFFLAIPVMFGASLLKGVKFLMHNSMTSMEGTDSSRWYACSLRRIFSSYQVPYGIHQKARLQGIRLVSVLYLV